MHVRAGAARTIEDASGGHERRPHSRTELGLIRRGKERVCGATPARRRPLHHPRVRGGGLARLFSVARCEAAQRVSTRILG